MREDSLQYLKSIISEKINNIDITDTLKRTSRRKDNGVKTYMTESLSIVINGDKLKNNYNKNGFCTDRLKATDAIYKFKDNKIYLIEFKSGSIKKEEVYQKVYDTYILLKDLNIIESLKFSLENIYYILVYNKIDKIENENIHQRYISQHIASICNYTVFKNKTFKDIGVFEGYLFKESFACTKDDFNNFIIKEFEKEENVY
ncbi:hypothetical protein [Brachyspira hampsonii]|uniref:Restriction endonuclease n=1 Tax=Brachyspira hampsonii TaxID=1287055 RepID=A0AAC9XKK3_9SPIR|nr:hypothetical protein [Brachyspira hampsonii]ASJ21358.1 hypothetical protein BHAMNSH16_06760 [Brachyspira hampsonii]ELV05363.1 hypothetical protein H263_10744 [Brachyspira hampsonii 30599]MBW5379412.1 hypothetical protein [Brachyspira hampsonii]OEJ17185.1 hypothetical protein A9496_11790 [Brachyspira hampsonii]